MDDRFLARGKRKDNGKWIEGDLIRSKGLYYIHLLSNGVTVKNTLGRLIVMHEIDSATFGWCTAFTDKNSKRIFEGDIVYLPDEEELSVIKWDVDLARFIIESDAGFILCDFDNYWGYELEVVGNIHDNKQMLERADMPVPNNVFQPVLMPATPENFELMHG